MEGELVGWLFGWSVSWIGCLDFLDWLIGCGEGKFVGGWGGVGGVDR